MEDEARLARRTEGTQVLTNFFQMIFCIFDILKFWRKSLSDYFDKIFEGLNKVFQIILISFFEGESLHIWTAREFWVGKSDSERDGRCCFGGIFLLCSVLSVWPPVALSGRGSEQECWQKRFFSDACDQLCAASQHENNRQQRWKCYYAQKKDFTTT